LEGTLRRTAARQARGAGAAVWSGLGGYPALAGLTGRALWSSVRSARSSGR